MAEFNYRVSYDIDIPSPDMEQVVNMSFSGRRDDYEKICARAADLNASLRRGTLRSSCPRFSDCTSLPRRFEEPSSDGKIFTDSVSIDDIPAYVAYLCELLEEAPDIGLCGKIYMKHPFVGMRNIYDVDWERPIGSRRGSLNVTQHYVEEWSADVHVPWPRITGGSSAGTARPRSAAAPQRMSPRRPAPSRTAPVPRKPAAPRKKMGYEQLLAWCGETDDGEGATPPKVIREITDLCLRGQVDLSYLEWTSDLLCSWAASDPSARNAGALDIMARIYRTQICRIDDPDTRDLLYLLMEDFLEKTQPENDAASALSPQRGNGCAVVEQQEGAVHAIDPQAILDGSPATEGAVHLADTMSHAIFETRLSIVRAFQSALLAKIDQERNDKFDHAWKLKHECLAAKRQIEHDREALRELRDSGGGTSNTERDISLWIESTGRELSKARDQFEQACEHDARDIERIKELEASIAELRRGTMKGSARKEVASKLAEITQLREQRIKTCDARSLAPKIDELSSRIERYRLLLDQRELAESLRDTTIERNLAEIEEREDSLARDELMAEEALEHAASFRDNGRLMARDVRAKQSQRVYWGTFHPLMDS